MALPNHLEISANCGERLLPAVVDEIATTDPERVFASIPRTSKIVDGFSDINYRAYARAVNSCAWWLKKELGEQSEPDVLLYLGPPDLRYLIIVTAAAKAGHIAFYSSHPDSLEAHLSLLERSKCHTILLPAQAPTMVKQILEARPTQTISILNVDFFLNDSEDVEVVPFCLNWEQAKDMPFCVLRTSGSTSIPKPVFVTYGTLACNDAHQLIPSLGGKPTLIDYLKGKRCFLALPVYHAACLMSSLAFKVFSEGTSVSGENKEYLIVKKQGAPLAKFTELVEKHEESKGKFSSRYPVIDAYAYVAHLTAKDKAALQQHKDIIEGIWVNHKVEAIPFTTGPVRDRDPEGKLYP